MSGGQYPLHWPPGWARAKEQINDKFKTSLHGALQNVQKSIKLFGEDSDKLVENVVISSNVTLGNHRPTDPGVSIFFDWDGIHTCIAVDRYKKVEANLQAIHHCLEAERTKLRHGGLNLVRAAFRGYAGLPPPSEDGAKRKWWEVLECGNCAARVTINNNYKRLRGKYHPDKPEGDAEKFHEVQQAYEEATS